MNPSKKPTKPEAWYEQSGVIPFRNLGGRAEVLLVSSRGGKRWVIPKGIREPGLSLRNSAVKEAHEEAGVAGEVSELAVGAYEYGKWGGTCHVEVFLMNVGTELDDWPEAGLRRRRWVTPGEAAELVAESALSQMLSKLTQLAAACSWA